MGHRVSDNSSAAFFLKQRAMRRLPIYWIALQT